MSDPLSAPAASPMSAQDRELLSLAATLQRPLKRAAALAKLNGAGYAVFGVLSLMIAIPGGPDWIGLVVGIVLLVVGLVERTAAARMLAGDRGAPKRLAMAELSLLAAIVVYGILGLLGLAGDASQLGDISGSGLDINSIFSRIVYPTVIAVALLYQGGMARYFLARRADLERYFDEVPEWARDVMQGIGD